MKQTTILLLLIFGLLMACTPTGKPNMPFDAPGAGNPLVPGYFADPTLIKIGDVFYLYATTDGVRLASGEPQVWRSKDFKNWYNQEIDLPFALSNVWAPDVVHDDKGNYYYFHGNCEAGCNVYGYKSSSPLGPWKSLHDGAPLFTPNTLEGLPALDQHYFFDDDGSLYVYYGTWIHNFKGLGWLRIDTSDMSTVLDKGFIPNSELPEIFEAPYMVKKNNTYIMMYASGDCQASSYRVQYAYSNSPTGPFTFGENNPILETNADGTVDGPGHHSVFSHNGGYYIVYHRHDNPHSGGGEFRQLCIDTLVFLNDSTLQKVTPTHSGIARLAEPQVTATDYAYRANASATSSYHLNDGKNDYGYSPKHATDNNNGTLWRAGKPETPQSLVVDLGKQVNVKRILTQFEYATFYYQYKIEYGADSLTWALFADKTHNRASGSPMVDDGDVKARYIKITITGTEKTAMFPAIWNMKVYSEKVDTIGVNPEISNAGPGAKRTNSMLLELNAQKLPNGEITRSITNPGSLGGSFAPKGTPTVKKIGNLKAISFDGAAYLKLSEPAPFSLSWNSPFTVSVWVLNPEVGNGECILVWSGREGNLMGEYAALMYGSNPFYGAAAHWGRLDMPYASVPKANQWHHFVLTFDGMVEKIYVDGKLDNQGQKNLFVHEGSHIQVGYSGEPSEYLSGAIATLRMWDKAFPADSIPYLMHMDRMEMQQSRSLEKESVKK